MFGNPFNSFEFLKGRESNVKDWAKDVSIVCRKAEAYDQLMQILDYALEQIDDAESGKQYKATVVFKQPLFSIQETLKNAKVEIEELSKL